jgi:quercetin dioxygenase-like cupin family protein
MSMNNSASGLTTASSSLTRLPFLASPSLHFHLADDLSELRNQDSWKRNSGRSSKTLVKYPDLHIVLILMKADSQMSEHHVDAHISIHLLQGRLRIQLPDQRVELSAGELFALDYGIPHDVVAMEESAFLITISWPGGTKDERHTRYIMS